ncbi:hypothetical protein [Nocardia araoensis]|uniref:hypothetical protein n=1 Tax=Nocardia araoensis TaxID=228600 RepID=UPI0012F6817A|nr:hypothetical protein [Nocardia araoensis]
MGSYTVVIIPDSPNGQGCCSDAPQLAIRVDASASDTRVTGIAISTTGPAGLTSQQVCDIDIEAVVTALARRFLPLGPRAAVAATPSAVRAEQSEQMMLENVSVPALADQAATPRTTDGEGGRAYRRMPDVNELRATYERLGTVTAVAKHFGVPRHTAQGWMGRLRKLDPSAETSSTNKN